MNTYPVNLLLSGRRCLLVGGGKVAARKLDKLISSGADITVIAPKPCSHIAEIEETGKITLHLRNFQNDDIENVFLVYAATDDHALNKRIAKMAEAKNMLVCSIDQNWTEGTYITPASFRNNDMTIAVSSNGSSCRKARLVKENILRHINSVESTELMIIGTDHRHLSQAIREPFHLDNHALHKTASMLTTLSGVQEFMLLNTCNRIEFVAASGTNQALLDAIKRILQFDKLKPEQYYLKTGFEAFAHFAMTASGLHSQITGENHITAQIKESLKTALEKHWSAGVLQAFTDNVLHVAKHVRNAIGVQVKAREIEDAAISFIHSHIPDLTGCRILIAGNGRVGTEMQKRLSDAAAEIKWLYHSKIPASDKSNITVFPLSRFPEFLSESDLIITALTSSKPILGAELAKYIKSNTLLVDLGVPRNISPEAVKLRTDLKSVTVDDLKDGIINQDMNASAGIFAEAAEIINEHRELYDRFIRTYSDGYQRQSIVSGADPAGN